MFGRVKALDFLRRLPCFLPCFGAVDQSQERSLFPCLVWGLLCLGVLGLSINRKSHAAPGGMG